MKKLFYLMLLFVGTTTMCSQTYSNGLIYPTGGITLPSYGTGMGIFSDNTYLMVTTPLLLEQQAKRQNTSVIINQRTNARGGSSAMLTIGRGQSKQQAQHAFVLYSMATGPITRETVQMFIVREAILKD